MSLASAFRRYDRELYPDGYTEIRTATERVVAREGLTDPRPAERIASLGLNALNLMGAGIHKTIPRHYNDAQRKSFAVATGLYVATMAEMTQLKPPQDERYGSRNSELEAELLVLSQRHALESIVNRATFEAFETQRHEESLAQTALRASADFHFLLTIGGEVDHSLIEVDVTPDMHEGTQRATINSAVAFSALASQLEVSGY